MIPIVINDAALPSQAELPEELRPLVGRQMLAMTDLHWSAVYAELKKAVRSEVRRRRSQRIGTFLRSRLVRAIVATAMAGTLAAAIAFTIANWKPAARPMTTTAAVPATTAAEAARETIGYNLSIRGRLDQARSDAAFVFMNVLNPDLENIRSLARERGLICGVYWSYNEARDPAEQADEFLRRARLQKQDLVAATVVLVSRRGAAGSISRDLHRFLERVEERTGKRPILYTTARGWTDHFDDTFGDYPLWFLETESYGTPPYGWDRPAFSAHALERTLNQGLPYELTFNGTLDELRALAQETITPSGPQAIGTAQTAMTESVQASTGNPSVDHTQAAVPSSVNVWKGDQKRAEELAARLIGHGYTSAYVERTSDGGKLLYTVRVKFASRPEAMAAMQKMREYSSEAELVPGVDSSPP